VVQEEHAYGKQEDERADEQTQIQM